MGDHLITISDAEQDRVSEDLDSSNDRLVIDEEAGNEYHETFSPMKHEKLSPEKSKQSSAARETYSPLPRCESPVLGRTDIHVSPSTAWYLLPPSPYNKKPILRLKKKEITKEKGENFMKLKPLHSLMKSQKEAIDVLRRNTQWHVPTPDIPIPQIVI